VERFNQIIQQKGEPEEFGQYLQFVEENGISIDKVIIVPNYNISHIILFKTKEIDFFF